MVATSCQLLSRNSQKLGCFRVSSKIQLIERETESYKYETW